MSKRTPKMLLAAGAVILLSASAGAGATNLPTTLAELNKWYIEPPKGSNAAIYFLEAAKVLSIFEAEQVAETSPWFWYLRPPRPGSPIPPEMNRSMAVIFERNHKLVEIMSPALACAGSRYRVDFEDTKAPFFYLRDIKMLSHFLALSALKQATDGKAEAAKKSVALNLALARSLSEEPLIFSQMTKSAIFCVAVESLEQVINRSPLSQESISQLQNFIGPFVGDTESSRGFTRGIIGDRIFDRWMMQQPREFIVNFFGTASDNQFPVGMTNLFLKHPQEEEAAFLDNALVRILQVLDRGNSDQLDGVRALTLTSKEVAIKERFVLGASSLNRISTEIEEERLYVKQLKIAQLALALEQFKFDHNGEYPEFVGNLIPNYLKAQPVDPSIVMH